MVLVQLQSQDREHLGILRPLGMQGPLGITVIQSPLQWEGLELQGTSIILGLVVTLKVQRILE